MITPHWDGRRWRIQVRHEGKRMSFSSSVPGVKGRREVQQKYDNWYYGSVVGEKSVERVAEEYMEDLKARCGENCPSIRHNEGYIRLYIVPKCGKKKICKMTLREWQAVINEATGQNKPLSEKTLKNLRTIIMALIKYGYEDYQCELPRGKLYIPKGHSKKEKEILQKDDVRRLFEPSDLFFHPMFCFLALTGLRPGEALGIKVEDVKTDRVEIKRSINDENNITEGKNENARRVIPLGSLAKKILEDTIARNEAMNLRTEWVFCSEDGSHGCQSTMRNHWNKLKKERNLPGTVYCLRHTFISMMKNVMPEQMVKDIVGHSVNMSTFETYGHIVDGDNERAAEIIDLTYSQMSPKWHPTEKQKTANP